MNWNKWMKNDLNKICKKRMTEKYCNNIILSKQKSLNLDIFNVILKIINIVPFSTRNEIVIGLVIKFLYFFLNW